MLLRLFKRIVEIIKKDIFVSLLLFLMIGVGVGLFLSSKKGPSGSVLDFNLSETTSTDTKIVVDLSGAVENPGLYELDLGSRVGDLIGLSGGAKDQAAAEWISKKLNLSEKLKDSSKIYIPYEWEGYIPEKYEINELKTVTISDNETTNSNSKTDDPDDGEGSETEQGDSGKINVNTSSSSELDKLPGIGSAYAEKIISGRPYENYSDFESRSGLWKSTLEGLKNLISF